MLICNPNILKVVKAGGLGIQGQHPSGGGGGGGGGRLGLLHRKTLRFYVETMYSSVPTYIMHNSPIWAYPCSTILVGPKRKSLSMVNSVKT